jgi:hypothetical protein
VVIAVPFRLAQALILVHREASFRVRGGSRLEVSAVDDRPKSQTSTAAPAEPGGTPNFISPCEQPSQGALG